MLQPPPAPDERRQLQVLVWEFSEFDTRLAAQELVTHDRRLRGPEGAIPALQPQAIQRFEARRGDFRATIGRSKSPSRPGHTSSPRLARKCQSSSSISRGINRFMKAAHGVPIERRRLSESARQKDPDGPLMHARQQIPMSQHKDAEGHLVLARREIEEDVTGLAPERHADRELVGEEAHGRLDACAEVVCG